MRKTQAYLENERWVSQDVLDALKNAWKDFFASKLNGNLPEKLKRQSAKNSNASTVTE